MDNSIQEIQSVSLFFLMLAANVHVQDELSKTLSPESAYHERNSDLADSIKSSKTEITKCNSINSR